MCLLLSKPDRPHYSVIKRSTPTVGIMFVICQETKIKNRPPDLKNDAGVLLVKRTHYPCGDKIEEKTILKGHATRLGTVINFFVPVLACCHFAFVAIDAHRNNKRTAIVDRQ